MTITSEEWKVMREHSIIPKEEAKIEPNLMPDIKKYSISEITSELKKQDARLIRKRYAETSISDYLSQIEPKELADKFIAFHNDHLFFDEVCAGAKHHHWWKCGLRDHCSEMIGMGMDIMDLYPGDFENRFTKTDLIIAVYLHDFAKIWIYRYITEQDRQFNKRLHEKQVFTFNEGVQDILDSENLIAVELMKYGMPITKEQWSAIVFAEGGFASAHYNMHGTSKTSETVNKRNPLASFVSMLDLYSSQILGRSLI